LLEIARALAGTRPRATIRLVFWSGEEVGLHGSIRYASALSTEDARAILVYANVDMIASPNGFAGVYDEPGAPVGSAAARDLLASDPISAEQAAASGAVAGRPGDACYHQSCDNVANANLALARVLAAGLADFTVRVANNAELLRH
jgi:Zn-dependent M28 family amino/carboxypeptidase